MASLYLCDDKWSKMVEKISDEIGLKECGINVIPLAKAKAKEVVKVQKGSDVINVLLDEENTVLLYMYTKAFEEVDDRATQEMWIKMALSQVSYNQEKDKVEIGGQMLTLPLSFYEQYGDDAIRKAELAERVIQQLSDK